MYYYVDLDISLGKSLVKSNTESKILITDIMKSSNKGRYSDDQQRKFLLILLLKQDTSMEPKAAPKLKTKTKFNHVSFIKII